MTVLHACRPALPTLAVLLLALFAQGCKSRAPEKPNDPRPTSDNVAADNWGTLDVVLTKADNPALYAEARTWLGTPYLYGGDKKHKGTDCSGFVGQVFKTVYGIALERNSAKIFANNCRPIKKEQLREADLVFFNNGGKRITHVGIYLRDGKFVHASSSRGVVVSDLGQRYYVKHYHCAGRVPEVETTKRDGHPKRSARRR